MPIPTEVVGSLPRPKVLQDTLVAYDEGRVDRETLLREQDKAARDSVERMAATGEMYITDGEQRNSSFATYPLTDTLGGTGLLDTMKGDGHCIITFEDGHKRQLPGLVRGPFRYKTYAHENFKLSLPYTLGTSAKLKQAVIAPSLLFLTYPPDSEIDGYPRTAFAKDLVDECEKDIRGCFAAGAARVSIDFTEGRLASRGGGDPGSAEAGSELLRTFISLINSVLERFTAEERKNIGLHTCPGGDCDSTHSADVPYVALLGTMFNINAGYFLIQLSSEADKEDVYRQIGKRIRSDAHGVKQVAFIGVTNPLDPRVETPEEICEQLVNASRYIPKDQLGATDDCGFSPFSIDAKPRHGGDADFARDVAFRKIANRIKGAALASRELGI